MSLTRSEQMARIRGKGTRPETLLQDALATRGVEGEANARDVLGRPDLVLREWRITVFVDGCFWHGCPTHYVRPRQRTEYWAERLRSNVDRDCRQTAALEGAGWRVRRVWEHEVFADVDGVVATILDRESPGSPDDWRVWKVAVVEPESDTEEQLLIRLRDPHATLARQRVRSTRPWPVNRPTGKPHNHP